MPSRMPPATVSGFTSMQSAPGPARRSATTIAHGFLTLSPPSALVRDAVTVGGVRMALNYGLNRVRFVSPVPSGSRIRARVALAKIDDMADSIQATWNVTIERDGGDKPAVVAEWIVRYYPGTSAV